VLYAHDFAALVRHGALKHCRCPCFVALQVRAFAAANKLRGPVGVNFFETSKASV
jgi:hypothetical protein